MKRYAIIEIPERISLNQYLAYGAWYPILTGPVELMEAACKEAGELWLDLDKPIDPGGIGGGGTGGPL